jgi:ATP-dependent RNA helicase DeaD
MKFSELNLKPQILEALNKMEYTELTPVQEQTLPHILAGRNLLAKAETGSGKTGACAVPLTQMVDPTLKAIQALILVPTRELALQYVDEIDRISKLTRVTPFAVYGGFSMEIQRAKLKDGVHVLVATPGRLIDFLYNTTDIDLTEVRTLVLDEADEMLKMGFLEDVDFIMSCMLHEHQTLLFAATMPREIEHLIEHYLKDPVRIELNKDQIAPQSLSHHFRHVGHQEKLQALLDYLKAEEVCQSILFCNSRTSGEKLASSLKGKLTSFDYIHGGLDQARRTAIIEKFRRRDIIHLVATDVAGRGLDFSHVSHVVNYDFPPGLEAYTHRTGRTGRMGRSGTAMTFVTDKDLPSLKPLFTINRIEPVWHGTLPDLEALSKRKRRGPPGKPFRKSSPPGRRKGTSERRPSPRRS